MEENEDNNLYLNDYKGYGIKSPSNYNQAKKYLEIDLVSAINDVFNGNSSKIGDSNFKTVNTFNTQYTNINDNEKRETTDTINEIESKEILKNEHEIEDKNKIPLSIENNNQIYNYKNPSYHQKNEILFKTVIAKKRGKEKKSDNNRYHSKENNDDMDKILLRALHKYIIENIDLKYNSLYQGKEKISKINADEIARINQKDTKTKLKYKTIRELFESKLEIVQNRSKIKEIKTEDIQNNIKILKKLDEDPEASAFINSTCYDIYEQYFITNINPFPKDIKKMDDISNLKKLLKKNDNQKDYQNRIEKYAKESFFIWKKKEKKK